jgi:hypothetical protein
MRLLPLLQREPAAIGTLLASVLPCLVLLGLLHLDEKAIAAVVVAVNAMTTFLARLLVTPNVSQPAALATAAERQGLPQGQPAS